MTEQMNRQQLQELTVGQLREYIKANGMNVVGAWKMKKEDLIEAIVGPQERLNQALQAVVESTDQTTEEVIEALEETVVEAQEEEIQVEEETQEEEVKQTPQRRGNRKKLHVVLEDNTELDFESNKEFAEYFNEKHNTTFRHDVAWYIIRDRNKKAKQVFEIKEITQG